MIDIIKNNNIYQVKQFEIDIINIKNKDSLITILENYIINLREIQKSNIEDQDSIKFIKNQIQKYNKNINLINKK